MKAMILAAGRGERMRPLTDTCPKPLLTVQGKPLIIYHIEALKVVGITEIVINTAWLGEKIESQLGDGSQFGVSIHYSRELEGLETAGGIRHALPLLGEQPFLLVNGDIWSDFDFSVLVRRGLKSTELAHLVLVENPEHNPEGDFVLAASDMLHTKEMLDQPAHTFSGISLISPALIEPFPEPDKLALREPLFAAIAKGQVSAHLAQNLWFDIGTPARLSELENLLKRQA